MLNEKEIGQMNFFQSVVTDLKQQHAAAFLFLLPPPQPRQTAGQRASVCRCYGGCYGVRLALEGERCIQTSGAAQPNCLAAVQLLIDPINSNESGFLQSDLLPLPVMCLSQSMKSWNLSAGFDKGSERGGKEGKKRQITAECNQCFITILRKWEWL